MDNALHCLEPVLVNSGEAVLTLPLHVAVCRALYDLGREVPFAVRRIDDTLPFLSSDGDHIECVDPDLLAILQGTPPDRALTAHPSHPADPVRLTGWQVTAPDETTVPETVELPLTSALSFATVALATGTRSGMIQPLVREPSAPVFLLWRGFEVMGGSGWVDLVRLGAESLSDNPGPGA